MEKKTVTETMSSMKNKNPHTSDSNKDILRREEHGRGQNEVSPGTGTQGQKALGSL